MPAERRRYGIAEWYGRSFTHMSPQERKDIAEAQAARPPQLLCPWRSSVEQHYSCNKKGGVCSLRVYHKDPKTGSVSAPAGEDAGFSTVCPNRFYERGMIFRWIGETVLGCPEPIVLPEIAFLERTDSGARQRGDVGRIDRVLVVPSTEPLRWCALEMQAVYFSGAAMSSEFTLLREFGGPGIPFPVGHRRPDFRSSGPKRLMPQLQIKVPALRRWGKRMAVVVDRAFFENLARMNEVPDISNCDIAWFVVRYAERATRLELEQESVRLTTLENAVEGLTAGKPVSLETFEARIREKLAATATRHTN